MRVLAFLLFFLVLPFANGQTDKPLIRKLLRFEKDGMADSLYQTLGKVDWDDIQDAETAPYEAYFKYFDKEFDLAKKDSVLRKTIAAGEEVDDQVLVAKANLRLGRLMRKSGLNDSTEYYYLRSLEAIEQSDSSQTMSYQTHTWAEILYTLSAFYHRRSRYEKGINYGLSAVEKANATDDDYLKLTASVNLSAIYGELASEDNILGSAEDRKRYKKRLKEHSLRALEFASRLPHESASGWAYLNYATYLTEDADWEGAFDYIKQAIQIFDAKEYLRGQALAYDLMGNYFRNAEREDSAFYYLHRASSFAEKSGTQNIIAETRLNLGYLSLSSKDTATAILLLKEVSQLAESHLLFREALQANLALSKIAEAQGKPFEALAYFKKFSAFQDSAVSEKNYARIEKLRTQFETEKKEAEIKELTIQNQIQELQLDQRNLLLWIVGIVFISILTIVYLIYNQNLVGKKKEANDLKQKLLRVQLNPHFMFNSLNAIQNLVYKDADKLKTADYLARFSHLTRQILELNQHDFISLEDEVRFIENYLIIQQIRFDEPFDYAIDIADEVDLDGTMIPPMITQPFLENAIEHGIINKRSKGEIKLRIAVGDTHLHLAIEDNGVGRNEAAFEKRTKKHRSLATQITLDRLDNLQVSFRKHALMTIEDIRKAGLIMGTRVKIDLPLKFAE
ncbi:MAG: histidine kinase [Bacteroidota bacterium]